MRTWASNAVLLLQLWQLSCSGAATDDIMKAVSGAAKLFVPCGIRVRALPPERLKSIPAWCDLPSSARERKPLLMAMARPQRLKNLRGLSVFVLPTARQARNAFSIIDESIDAGCGSPRDAQFLPESGSVFLTDFGLAQDSDFSAQLLAHEIAHELTMKQHPTKAPRGYVLADHVADFGPKISPSDCACMLQSPFLKPESRP